MASGFAPNRPKITPVSRRESVCAAFPVSVLNVTSKPAPTKCFQGIETSVVSKSLSGSGMITFIAIASPIVVVSTALSLLVEVLLALYQSPHFMSVEVYHGVRIINQQIVIEY